jgi:hypothetical protein
MGYSLSWLSCRGLPPESLLSRLALSTTDRTSEHARSSIAMQQLRDDWTLVVARGCDHRIIRETSLAGLSAGCEVVACSIEEHVNYASSEYWRNGKRAWRIEHASDEDFRHLARIFHE